MALRPSLSRSLLYVLAITSIVHAGDLTPQAEYEGKAVAHVRFDPATQPLATADLTRALAFSPGVQLHLADVRAAIKRLYGTGEYSNIEVDTEPAADGVSLIFRTTSQWFVGSVDVKGKINQPPSASQLASATRLDLGAPFSDRDVDTAVDNLRTLLQRNGLYRGAVTPEVVRDSQHEQVAITFRVDSGKRARLMLPNVVGDTKIPAANVARAAKYKEILFFPWKLATQTDLQNGLQSVRHKYEKQDRLTASVTLDRSDYLAAANRVQPTIRADGGPKVKIDADGAKVSKKILKRYVPVFDEGTVNQDLLVTGARNLRDYFQNRGYFDVQVGLASHNASPDLEVITYKVSLGAAHRVVSLTVKGNRYFTTAEIRERMFLQPKGFIRLRRGRYSQGFATRDGEAIQALYRDSGFRDCQVTANTVDNYRGRKGDVAITVNIKEGPQYLVSHLAVNGITLKNKDAILSSLTSSQGQPFSETAVAVDRDYILAQYQSAGYPDATFAFHTTPAGPQQVSVQYTVTEGMPQYVRDVLISGLHTSRRRLVDPLISLHSGDPLSWTEMGDMQRRLYNLGVFDTVDTAIRNPDGDDEQKYVDLHLVEGHLYSMAVGVGAEIAKIGGSATSISNPTGVTGFAPRFDLQLSRLNLWGLGQSLVFNGRYSTLDRRAALSYVIPKFHNSEDRNITFTGLYDNTRDVLTFTAVRLQGAVQVSQRLSKATKLLFRYSWTDDRVDQSTLKIDPLLIPLYSQPSQVGLFGVNLVQDRRDDPADAHRGIYNSLDVALAAHTFGGNKNFARFLARNSYYKKLVGNLILASNTEFGVIHPFSTDGIATDEYVPLPERFFGGGESTMRGFPMNQAGPRDPDTGFPLGGNALLFHSTELRFPLIGDNISGVFFHDMGNIYTGLGSISFSVHQNGLTDFNYMVHAAGFGIRYRTPLGPVRVDLAYSINPPTFNGLQGTYDQLLFGGATKTVQSVSHFQYFFSIGQAF
jgi:outer membrane protein insertion porin family